LLWGVIAFFWEGSAWKGNRETVNERDRMETSTEAVGSVILKETDLVIG